MKSLTGHNLNGNRLVRLTYMDESGNTKECPIVVVSGVMIDADGHLARLEEDMEDIAAKLAPEFGPDFVFHACDIWGGNGEFKGRKDWPFERRIELLKELSFLPAKHRIPVAIGMIIKEDILSAKFPSREDFANLSEQQKQLIYHVTAFGQCSAAVEAIMKRAFDDEITLLVIEDCEEAKAHLKEVHFLLKNPNKISQHHIKRWPTFPYRHIKEGPHFIKKDDSKCLQLADMCCYLTRSYFGKGNYRRDILNRLYENIESQFVFSPDETGSFQEKQIIIS